MCFNCFFSREIYIHIHMPLIICIQDEKKSTSTELTTCIAKLINVRLIEMFLSASLTLNMYSFEVSGSNLGKLVVALICTGYLLLRCFAISPT